MFEFSPSVIIWTLLNFSALVIGLRFLLYKPIMRMLDKRRQDIDTALLSAEQAKKLAASTEENLRLEIAQARAQAERIVAEAKAQSEQQREEIVTAAREQALSIAAQAKAEIEQEKTRALAEIKGEIADLVLLTAEKLLASSLTAAQEQALLEQYVKQMGQLQ